MNSERLKQFFKTSQYEALHHHIDDGDWVELVRALADEIAQDELNRREEYLQAIVEMQRELLTSPGTSLGSLNRVLEPLGLASRASRVYLFENHTDEQGVLHMSQRAEWCAPGITPELDNPELQNLCYDDFFPRWSKVLGSGQNVQGIVRDFPEEEREILEAQGILSILVIPLMLGESFMGFIGFDDCVEARIWSILESNLLMSAASNISLVLEQRRAERDLIEVNRKLSLARDEAWQASKAKSTFLAKVSHELRTPLNAVIGYSELLLEDMDFEAADHAGESREDIERILKSGRHLLLMVDDLLDLSRIEVDGVKLRMKSYSLQGLIEDIVEMVQHSVETNHNQFEVQIAEGLGHTVTDRKAMTQILLNLLSNAFKYTHDGQVTLRVHHVDAEHYAIEIQDTGEGMTREDLARVFDAFVQADDSYTRVYEGVGLGLAISQRLCSALGIEIDVESTRHEGTTFTLLVPRTELVQA